jgi:hypothetical protein
MHLPTTSSYKIVIDDEFCNLFDVKRSLPARAHHIKNDLYLLKMQLAAPVYRWQRLMMRLGYKMLAMDISIFGHSNNSV